MGPPFKPQAPRALPFLVEPTRGELALLRPSARRLWASLIRCRDRAGGEGDWFIADLRRVTRYLGCAYSTTLRALEALKRSGLIATSRCQVPRWIKQGKRFESVMANEHNLYLMAGSYSRRSGVERFMFPRRAWSEFVEASTSGHVITALISREASPSSGGALQRIRVQAWRRPLDLVEWQPEWTTERIRVPSAARLRAFRKSRENLRMTTARSVSFSIGTLTGSSFLPTEEKKKGSRSSLSINLVGLFDGQEMPDGPFVFGSSAPCPWIPLPGSPTWVPLDEPLPRPPSPVVWMKSETTAGVQQREVIEAYRRAVKQVYGVVWKGWLRQGKIKARWAKLFSACASAMIDHSVPPKEWAIWRLESLKSRSPRFADRVPPINMVMNAKRVSEWGGWFRKSYVLPHVVYTIDYIRWEQDLRNQEAVRRHRGATGIWLLHPFPDWYRDKRKAEIKDGLSDPHDNWPRRPKYGEANWWKVIDERGVS